MSERDPIFGYCTDCPRVEELSRCIDKEAQAANKDSWVPLVLSELGNLASKFDCEGPIKDRTKTPEQKICAVLALQPDAETIRTLFEE